MWAGLLSRDGLVVTGKGTPPAKVKHVPGQKEGGRLGPWVGPPGCAGDPSECEEKLVVRPESCLHLVRGGSEGWVGCGPWRGDEEAGCERGALPRQVGPITVFVARWCPYM